MHLDIPTIDRLPGERPGSMSPWHGPVKIGKLLVPACPTEHVPPGRGPGLCPGAGSGLKAHGKTAKKLFNSDSFTSSQKGHLV
jgi:hypothetical protein